MDLRSARHPDKSDSAVTREPGPVAGAPVDLVIDLCPRFFQSLDTKDVSRRKRLQSLQDACKLELEKRRREEVALTFQADTTSYVAVRLA